MAAANKSLVPGDIDHLDVIGRLAPEFASRSAEHDREATFPYENVEALKAAGHYLMMLPKEYGGSGTALPDGAKVMRALGAADASTALIVAQHHAVVANFSAEALIAGHERIERFMKDEIAHGKIVALLAAGPEFEGREPTTASKTEGGFLLNGRKGFGTSSLVADWGTGPFMWQKSETERFMITPFYRTDHPGFTILDNWDTFGMRSTLSHDLLFEDLFVPDEYVMHIKPTGEAAAKFNSMPSDRTYSGFGIAFFSALYLGIADAAFAYVKEALAGRLPLAGGEPAIKNPGLQSYSWRDRPEDS